MRYYGRKSAKSKTGKGKKTIKKAIRSAKVHNFNRAVSKVISRKAETKVVNYEEWMNIYGPKSLDFTSGAGGVQCLTPMSSTSTGYSFNIPQGTAQGERVGNEIIPVSLKLRGVIRAESYFENTTNYNPCPLYVTLWVVKLRQHLNDTFTDLSTVTQNSFFQMGSVSQGFTGTLIDLVRDVNQDHIQLIARKTYKVGYQNYVSAFGLNQPNNYNQQYSNNDSPHARMFKLDLTKHLPKTMKFNDGSDNVTNQHRLWCFFTCHRTDNNQIMTSSSNLTGPQPADLVLGAEFRYKDI